jgi:predicted P-loop ATPase
VNNQLGSSVSILPWIDQISHLPHEWALCAVGENKRPYHPDNRNGTGWQHEGIERSRFQSFNGRLFGIGLLLGSLSGGIVAIDHDGHSADEKIEELSGESVADALPITVGFTSQRDGRYQLLYRIPQDLWDAVTTRKYPTGVKGEQVEFRWTGTQSVILGLHPATSGYRWLDGRSPWEVGVADSPDWVIMAMRDETPDHVAQPRTTWQIERPLETPIPLLNLTTKKHQSYISNGVSEGGRNDAGAAIARDLIGCQQWAVQSNVYFEGDAQSLFWEFANRSGLSEKETNTIWRSALKKIPTPSCSDEGLKNVVLKWERQNKPKVTKEKPSKVKPVTEVSDDEEPPEKEKEPNCVRLDRIIRNIGCKFAFNELTEEIEMDGIPIEDMDVLWADLSIHHNRNLNPKTSFVPVLKRLSLESKYHPVRQYLNKVSQKFNEKSPYLLTDEVLTMGLGLRPDDFDIERWNLFKKFMSRWLIGAVARVYEPGCKMDTALVLQGNQGSGKSQFFQILGGEYHVDSIGDLKNKDAYMKAATAWLVEWGELESIVGHKAASAVREFLTSREDIYRKPYSAGVTRKPRTYVVAGTTNSSNYLHDDTGTGSRRFLTIGWIKKVDREWLTENRDRIWAAATAEYKAGTRYWFEDKEIDEINERNREAEAVDPLNGLVADWLRQNPHEYVTSTEVMRGLKFENKDLTKALEMRIAIALKELGYEKKKRKVMGRCIVSWSVDTLKGVNQVSTEVSTASTVDIARISDNRLTPLTPTSFSLVKEEEEDIGCARSLKPPGENSEKEKDQKYFFEEGVSTCVPVNPNPESPANKGFEEVTTSTEVSAHVFEVATEEIEEEF